MASAGVSQTCAFKVMQFRSKAVMASRVMAASLVEAQSTMGETESGRMWVVLAISKGEKDELQQLNADC